MGEKTKSHLSYSHLRHPNRASQHHRHHSLPSIHRGNRGGRNSVMFYIMVLDTKEMNNKENEFRTARTITRKGTDDEFATARNLRRDSMRKETDLQRIEKNIKKIENINNGVYQFEDMLRDLKFMKNVVNKRELTEREKILLEEIDIALEDVDEFTDLKYSPEEVRQVIKEFKRIRTKCGYIQLPAKLRVCEKLNGECDFDFSDERLSLLEVDQQKVECEEELEVRSLMYFKIFEFLFFTVILALSAVLIDVTGWYVVAAFLEVLLFVYIFFYLE